MKNRKSRRADAAEVVALGKTLSHLGEAERLHVRIATLIQGHPAAVCMQALGHSLAGVIGFAAGTPEAAATLLAQIAAEMRADMVRNWPAIAKLRTQADRAAGGVTTH